MSQLLDVPLVCHGVRSIDKSYDMCGACHGSGWAGQFTGVCSRCEGTGHNSKLVSIPTDTYVAKNGSKKKGIRLGDHWFAPRKDFRSVCPVDESCTE